MGKIQRNALFRELQILKKIRSGEVSFRSHFKYEHSEWVQIVDFLITKIRREIMFGVYCERAFGPVPLYPVPTFDEWLSDIQKS